MQLIFDTDTNLDIETSMSGVEDIQNNKMKYLDIADTNDKKYNVSKDIVEVNKDEIAETLVNIPIDNEAEISRPDLSGVVGEQNSLQGIILQEDEFKNSDSIVTLSPDNEINHSNIIEKQNEDEAIDISEEDYMEDDIISIREEAFHEPDTQKQLLLNETHHSDDNNTKVDEEVKEYPNEIADNVSAKDEKDNSESKDEIKVSAAQCEKATETVVIDDTVPSVHCKTKAANVDEANDSIEAKEKDLLAYSKEETEMRDSVETEETSVKSSVLSVKKLDLPLKESVQEQEQEVNKIIDSDLTVHCNSNSEHSIKYSEMANQIKEINVPDEINLTSTNEQEKEFKNDANSIVMSVQSEKQANFATKAEMISKECVKTITSDTNQIIDLEEIHIESLNTGKADLIVTKEGDSIEMKESLIEANSILETDNSSTVLKNNTVEVTNKNIKNENNTNSDKKNSITESKANTELHNSQGEIPRGGDDKEIIENTPRDAATEPDIKLKGNTEVLNYTVELSHDMDVEEIIENSTDGNDSKINAKGTKADKLPIELQHVMDVDEVVENNLNDKNTKTVAKECDLEIKRNTEAGNSLIELQHDMDVEEIVENTSNDSEKVDKLNKLPSINSSPANNNTVPIINNSNKDKPIICKLSNTLDIFSDEEEECEKDRKVTTSETVATKEKQCINIDDDDDLMLIDEETSKVEKNTQTHIESNTVIAKEFDIRNTDSETGEKTDSNNPNLIDKSDQKETTAPVIAMKDSKTEIDINDKPKENANEKPKKISPLIPDNFVKAAKTKFGDMTREDLEEFCILKIVESIVDRSSLSDINNKLKEMTQGLEDYRKKATMLAKQNRDLQVVLKSVQEEQKKAAAGTPITPLKITRSVGVQVYMDKVIPRKKVPQQNVNNRNTNTPQNRNANPSVRSPCPPKPNVQNIPVPRLVPANNPSMKTPSTITQINQTCTPNKNSNPLNGVVRNHSPAQKADKRPHNKIASGETVDLTDDEPPAKMPGGPKNSIAPPVRVVPSQTLMPPQRQPFIPNVSSPRKVFIPISGQGNQTLRPGQTIMLKTIPAAGIRPRCPTPQRVDSNSVRINRVTARHPAPLPLAMKQYQPPNWKPLPPSPDLKLSKVENGLVISWKIEDVPEDSYEEIASYQLFAYQETSLPPNTALWKKIGDVKALPLPMACTLTQFMAGYKYYFAVRAVDIRSRLGPFSLPGSILLLNKNVID